MACIYTFLMSSAEQSGDGEGILRYLAEVEVIAQIKLLVKIASMVRTMPQVVQKNEILHIIDKLSSELMTQLEIVVSSP